MRPDASVPHTSLAVLLSAISATWFSIAGAKLSDLIHPCRLRGLPGVST